MYRRWIEPLWKKKFGAPYVHLVFGARQTGRSTLLRKLLPDAAVWLDFFRPAERAEYLDIFNGRDTSTARRTCPKELWKVAARKLELLDSAIRIEDVRAPPGNHLEALGGARAGQHSIRINDQYRVCFVWSPEGPSAVEIVDYH